MQDERTFTVRAFQVLFLVNLATLILFGGVMQNPLIGNPNENFMLSPSTIAERPWTFVTSAFMHAGFIHFLVNMAALWSLIIIDKVVAIGRKLVPVYLFALVGSSLFVLVFSTTGKPTVGASGAIFGIMGFYLTYYKYQGYRASIILNVAINAAIVFFIPIISWQAHLGGFLFGALVGYAYNVYGYRKLMKLKPWSIPETHPQFIELWSRLFKKSMILGSLRASSDITFLKLLLEKGESTDEFQYELLKRENLLPPSNK